MLLIVGAFPPETELLEDLVGPGLVVQSAGIGPVDAILGLEALVTEFAPDEVIFLGSCGQYRGSPECHFIQGQLFTYLDPASILGRSRMVPAMRKYSMPRPGEFATLCMESGEFTPAIVNTTMSLSLEAHGMSYSLLEQAIEGLESLSSTDAKMSPWIGSRERGSLSVTENLEVFGMARFCEIHKIGFSSLMAVTNQVGPDGSAQWARNYQSMGRQLQEKVRRLVEKRKG